MEINAVLACLQPNYLLCPSRPSLSSSFPAAAAATFLPLSSSQRTRFSPPQLLKVTSLIVLLLLLHFLLDSLFFCLIPPRFSCSYRSKFQLPLPDAMVMKPPLLLGVLLFYPILTGTCSLFSFTAVLSDSYRCLLFVFFHCSFIVFNYLIKLHLFCSVSLLHLFVCLFISFRFLLGRGFLFCFYFFNQSSNFDIK